MTLFFDTETNGLPVKFNAPATEVNNWPRVIQLAFMLFMDDGTEVFSFKSLITPDGWEIPKEEFWLKHGYSTERNAAEGVPIEQALASLATAINDSEVMVAHNISFDYPVVVAEMLRKGITAKNKPIKVCTMKSTTDLCKLPGKKGYKWPKLEELHRYLFNIGFDGAHDALEDVRATARCYFELKRRGHFPAPQIG